MKPIFARLITSFLLKILKDMWFFVTPWHLGFLTVINKLLKLKHFAISQKKAFWMPNLKWLWLSRSDIICRFYVWKTISIPFSLGSLFFSWLTSENIIYQKWIATYGKCYLVPRWPIGIWMWNTKVFGCKSMKFFFHMAIPSRY